MLRCPPCLEPIDEGSVSGLPYQSTIFHHQPPLKPVFSLWWPCKSLDQAPNIVLLFVPGNPGLVEFYIPFLSTIMRMDTSGRIAICAHAHAGHTPKCVLHVDSESTRLFTQVWSAIDAFDALQVSFPKACISVVGHSVGAWIALQVLKVRNNAAGCFLLFPTISHIAQTPNGGALSWAFRYPMPTIISWFARASFLLPPTVLALLFPSWPVSQLSVLQRFLRCPSAIYATLCMAHDEMGAILDLDEPLLNANKHRLWMMFSKRDDWVGEELKRILHVMDSDGINSKIIRNCDIPHAFCIDQNHSVQLAQQFHEWLQCYPMS